MAVTRSPRARCRCGLLLLSRCRRARVRPASMGLRPRVSSTDAAARPVFCSFAASAGPRGDLGGWATTRDFWWIAGWECFLKLTVQLVIKLPFFALFSRLFFLRHCATSVLGFLDCATIRPSLTKTHGTRRPGAEQRRLPGQKQCAFMAPGHILFDGGEAEASDWKDYGLADI
jgi:hypothetical protein